MYYVERWQKYFEPFLCFVLVMQTALCSTSPQSILETAVSHAYPEKGTDGVALYCLSVYPHSLWEGGKTQECCAAKNTPDSWRTKFSAKPQCQIFKYKFKWIQKWEKCTCYRKTLRKYAIKEMDYAILNTFTTIVDLSRFNNSCLKLPALTLVDLIFQSCALCSFSLNQLHDLSL